MNRRKREGDGSNSLDGYLDLSWHGAHDSGQGVHREVDGFVPVARDVRGGQFDLYFCSTGCLRKFLNHCVDLLDRDIENEERIVEMRMRQQRRKAKQQTARTQKPR